MIVLTMMVMIMQVKVEAHREDAAAAKRRGKSASEPVVGNVHGAQGREEIRGARGGVREARWCHNGAIRQWTAARQAKSTQAVSACLKC